MATWWGGAEGMTVTRGGAAVGQGGEWQGGDGIDSRRGQRRRKAVTTAGDGLWRGEKGRPRGLPAGAATASSLGTRSHINGPRARPKNFGSCAKIKSSRPFFKKIFKMVKRNLVVKTMTKYFCLSVTNYKKNDTIILIEKF